MRATDALDKAGLTSPDAIFVKQGSISVNYQEAVSMSHRIASKIQSMGITVGTRVAFLSPNDWRGLIFMYGLWRAGMVLVPVNVRNSPVLNAGILRQHKPSAMVYHSQVTSLAAHVKEELHSLPQWCCLDRQDDETPSLIDWMAPLGSIAKDLPNDPLTPWTLYSTSGTTGSSKGVMHTHLSNYVTSVDMLFSMRAHEAKRHLVVAPMTHFAGSFIFALTMTGSTHVLLDKADPLEILETIEKEKIQILFLPPTVIYMLLASKKIKSFDYRTLENFVYAAAPMAEEPLKQALRIFGPVMMNMYGQAEAIGPITSLSPTEHMQGETHASTNILRSIGSHSISRQVQVMREDGLWCETGEPGEIVLRDWVSSAAYLEDEPASALVHRYGWYHTGDVGAMDQDGRITLLDRKKDVIISGGFNIYSAGVEQALMTHPAVQEACVFGIPNDKWGESVHAVLELKPGCLVEAIELQSLVKAQIGSISAPKSLEFTESLPRSATGKVLKRELRLRYWQGRNRAI
jgi:acyl-CoA synthetase (AMP-forming)/AMP-acid ligase II